MDIQVGSDQAEISEHPVYLFDSMPVSDVPTQSRELDIPSADAPANYLRDCNSSAGAFQ